jgi:hypothetical protein
MRAACGIGVILLSICAVTAAAERAWKTGAWAPRAESGAYTIETPTDLITGEAGAGAAAPKDSAGAAVQFAIEGQTLYVLDPDKTEHALKLLASRPKYSPDYPATGAGHFIKSVAPGGTSVTLEDGSRWDVDPRQHFAVAGWQVEDLMSVRRSNDDPAFAFEIDNTTQDDGALANYRIR